MFTPIADDGRLDTPHYLNSQEGISVFPILSSIIIIIIVSECLYVCLSVHACCSIVYYLIAGERGLFGWTRAPFHTHVCVSVHTINTHTHKLTLGVGTRNRLLKCAYKVVIVNIYVMMMFYIYINSHEFDTFSLTVDGVKQSRLVVVIWRRLVGCSRRLRVSAVRSAFTRSPLFKTIESEEYTE